MSNRNISKEAYRDAVQRLVAAGTNSVDTPHLVKEAGGSGVSETETTVYTSGLAAAGRYIQRHMRYIGIIREIAARTVFDTQNKATTASVWILVEDDC